MASINRSNILLLMILGMASLAVVMGHDKPGEEQPAQPQPQQPTLPSEPEQPAVPEKPADEPEIPDVPLLPNMPLKPLIKPGGGAGMSLKPFGRSEKMLCAGTPDPLFCETIARGSKTAMQATARSITITIVVAKRMQPVIHKFIDSLPSDVPPALKNTSIDTCNKDYQEVIQNYLGALDFLYSGDIDGLDIKLTSVPMENCLKSVMGISNNCVIVQTSIKELGKYCIFTKLLAEHLKK